MNISKIIHLNKKFKLNNYLDERQTCPVVLLSSRSDLILSKTSVRSLLQFKTCSHQDE